MCCLAEWMRGMCGKWEAGALVVAAASAAATPTATVAEVVTAAIAKVASIATTRRFSDDREQLADVYPVAGGADGLLPRLLIGGEHLELATTVRAVVFVDRHQTTSIATMMIR
jgi:hypothetical protein